MHLVLHECGVDRGQSGEARCVESMVQLLGTIPRTRDGMVRPRHYSLVSNAKNVVG